MVDARTEGALAAAIVLIPLGIGMVQTGTDVGSKAIGAVLIVAGLVAIYLRGLQKDAVASMVKG
jgi:hypothetical protein